MEQRKNSISLMAFGDERNENLLTNKNWQEKAFSQNHSGAFVDV